ncbi:hypothetical protein E6P78_31690 [Streptomyces sp. A0958]|uniref:hypothetical protein n=1 Tax=Streptomyces sp. A0958 TaxID=2563101 RepID=UPI00109EAC20|nr:hypothetical protein [Streptomyces sp. A0958]THA56779.1 hypothetical protein E6P78_31690 [Streptomyces sp. A0958]
MGKSARVLGEEFGRTAREMNALLKQYGYLDGNPGAYGITEKGQQYAKEQYHSRGTGGYAQYNRNWESRTWSEDTVAALRADMEANPGGFDDGESPAKEEAIFEPEPIVDDSGSGGDDDPQLSWKELAIGGAVVGAILIAPHVKPFWDNKVKPVAKKLRDRLAKQEAIEPTES